MGRATVAYVPRSESLAADAVPAGLDIVCTVAEPGRDRQGPGRDRQGPGRDREGLAEALSWIDSGRAETLLVPRLTAVARSLRELVRLIGWLGERRASLVVVDTGLDTATRSGRLVLDVLREVDRWAREPELPKRPPGRPGLQTASPELAQRIGAMRERGLSLQAIAEALNAEGVPTPRGGARWRPSSVQTALGYRRPHPPPPGPPGRGRRPGPGAPR